jgi:hypothetical protein
VNFFRQEYSPRLEAHSKRGQFSLSRPERDTPNRFFVPNVEMFRYVNAVAEFYSAEQAA